MIRRLATFVLDRPALSLAGLLLMIALAVVGATRLQVDFSSTSFYRGDDEMLPALEELRKQWGPDDDVLVLVAHGGGEDMLDDKPRSKLRALGDDLLALDVVVEIVSVGTLHTPRLLLTRPPFVPLLLSKDHKYAAVAVRMAFSSDDLAAVVPAVERIEQVVRTHETAELTIKMAGLPAVRAGFFRLTLRDQMIFVPAAFVLIGVALAFAFRRLHGVLAPAVAAGIPTLLLVGCMGWFGEPLGLLNQVYFTLTPVLAVADAVHMVARFHEELRKPDVSRRQAAIRAAERVGLACLMTTSTTALGFASLGLANMPILRSFGWFAALGMVLAHVTVLVVVPLVLAATRSGPPVLAKDTPKLVGLGRLAIRRPYATILLFVALGAVMVMVGSRVVVDNRLTDLLEEDHPVRMASDDVDTHLGGTLSLEVDLKADAKRLSDVAVMQTMRELESWANGLAGVRVVLGPGVPGTPQFLSGDGSRGRISIRVAEPGGRAFEELAVEVQEVFTGALRPHGIEATATGSTLVAYRGVNRITGELRTSLTLVFGVVTGIILLWFRSPRIALISLLPNGLPLLIGYGFVGLSGWTLDPLAAVVLVLALGIAVDDTIHLLARVREELEAGRSLEAAILESLRHSGRAVMITSFVLAGGLAINVFSSFPPLKTLGSLGAIVMLSALVCDLLLLPALLMVLGGERLARSRGPVPVARPGSAHRAATPR